MGLAHDGFTAQYKEYKLQQYIRSLSSERLVQQQHKPLTSAPVNLQQQSANAHGAGVALVSTSRPNFTLQRMRRPFTAAVQGSVASLHMQPTSCGKPSDALPTTSLAPLQQREKHLVISDFQQKNVLPQTSLPARTFAAAGSWHAHADDNEENLLMQELLWTIHKELRPNKHKTGERKVCLAERLHAHTDARASTKRAISLSERCIPQLVRQKSIRLPGVQDFA